VHVLQPACRVPARALRLLATLSHRHCCAAGGTAYAAVRRARMLRTSQQVAVVCMIEQQQASKPLISESSPGSLVDRSKRVRFVNQGKAARESHDLGALPQIFSVHDLLGSAVQRQNERRFDKLQSQKAAPSDLPSRARLQGRPLPAAEGTLRPAPAAETPKQTSIWMCRRSSHTRCFVIEVVCAQFSNGLKLTSPPVQVRVERHPYGASKLTLTGWPKSISTKLRCFRCNLNTVQLYCIRFRIHAGKVCRAQQRTNSLQVPVACPGSMERVRHPCGLHVSRLAQPIAYDR
jgi:hypothetical protein